MGPLVLIRYLAYFRPCQGPPFIALQVANRANVVFVAIYSPCKWPTPGQPSGVAYP
jgi:hypothetical protein